jgi:hypothetical protein
MANVEPAERLNDPRKVDYPPARPAVPRSLGTTLSERYLAKLADRSFLNLWSYPNTFIDKKTGAKGDGKELCDLLVVCGDHILIFSVKAVVWPGAVNEQIAWKRWYKRAIAKSVDQIRGAERWITQFPDRIFLDRQCTQRLPLPIPPPERRKVHGIAVALGAGNACKEFFGEGVGSLMVAPSIQGNAHCSSDPVLPFFIGDVDPSGSFIHVLDDATLDIVLHDLDTITDLTAYLTKKERLIRSGQLIVACGEEDLLAYYMTHMSSEGVHDFTKPDGSNLGPTDVIGLQAGFHAQMTRNPQYLAKKQADENSYVWDSLIEAFTTHILDGTTIVPDGQPFVLSELEEGVRHMAIVPRYLRRMLGDSILDALRKGASADRFARGFFPLPNDPERDTGFFFMTLSAPSFELAGGYEQYRSVRRAMLETYAFSFLQKKPALKQVVGIATEPLVQGRGSSEDLIVVYTPEEWTPIFLAELEKQKKVFNIVQPGAYTEYAIQGNEFPEIPRRPPERDLSHLNRRQRRARAAEARRWNQTQD